MLTRGNRKSQIYKADCQVSQTGQFSTTENTNKIPLGSMGLGACWSNHIYDYFGVMTGQ